MTTSSGTNPQAVENNATRGRFVWYDLMTTDVAAAIAFYTKIAGWGTEDFPAEGGPPYRMWTVGGTPIGGVMALTPEMAPPGTPPYWMGSVSVPDVDESVRQAEALGGKVLAPPADIPQAGRYAVLADPQGAVFAVFTSLNPAPAGPYNPAIGEFSWHELMTTDHEGAFAFYSRLFGWEKGDAHDMGAPVGVYMLFGQRTPDMPDGPRDAPYGGMYSMGAEMGEIPPNWGFYIRVASTADTVETVKALGGQVINGPMEVPGGDRVAQCLDPQGAMFSVHSKGS